MSEGAPAIQIEMPSAVILRQRLGQVSTNPAFRTHIAPPVEALADQVVTPDGLLDAIEQNIDTYAEQNLLGITVLAYVLVPKIVDRVMDKDSQKEITLKIWEERLEEKAAASSDDARQIQRARRYHKSPRKQKKAINTAARLSAKQQAENAARRDQQRDEN